MNFNKLLLLALFLLPGALMAQTFSDTLNLSFGRKWFPLKSIPFGKIEVLDNRVDTTGVFTYQTGSYPAWNMVFKHGAAGSIKDYFDTVISHVAHGEQTLLFNIRQLRIPNIPAITVRSRKNGKLKAMNMRGFLFIAADAYYKTGDGYRKIVSIERKYGRYSSPSLININVSRAIADLIAAAGFQRDLPEGQELKAMRELRKVLSDTVHYKYSSDTLTYSLSEINRNISDVWAGFAVNRDSLPRNGEYTHFDDFKNNVITSSELHVKYSDKDSIYRIVAPERPSGKIAEPWALIDNGNIYIHFYRDGYQKMDKRNGTWYFYIPYSFPDMYAMLSVWEKESGGSNFAAPNSGNALADLTGLLTFMAIEGIIDATKHKKINDQGMFTDYRTCYLDMDTGDIIYSREPYR